MLTTWTQRLSHQRWACALALRLTPIERALQRLSTGRYSLTGTLGIPLLLLTVPGRATGKPRSVPLIYTRHAHGYLVLGSNGARHTHPQWTANLLASPHARITLAGATIPVCGRLVRDGEREHLWQHALRTWPPYETYTTRSGRTLRMFHLVPAAKTTPAR